MTSHQMSNPWFLNEVLNRFITVSIRHTTLNKFLSTLSNSIFPIKTEFASYTKKFILCSISPFTVFIINCIFNITIKYIIIDFLAKYCIPFLYCLSIKSRIPIFISNIVRNIKYLLIVFIILISFQSNIIFHKTDIVSLNVVWSTCDAFSQFFYSRKTFFKCPYTNSI